MTVGVTFELAYYTSGFNFGGREFIDVSGHITTNPLKLLPYNYIDAYQESL